LRVARYRARGIQVINGSVADPAARTAVHRRKVATYY
jgi:hypothetical protein